MSNMEDTCARLQKRIDELSRRMQLDANDLDYETHLRQKRELQSMLDHLTSKNAAK